MAVSTRRFDLYDFFSVFVPGATLIVGLLPFLPDDTDLGSLVTLIPLVLGGYVVGRGLHSAAAKIDDELGGTHRTRFFDQFEGEPADVTPEARDRFLADVESAYRFTGGRETEPPRADGRDLATLYATARSAVHIDGRGRSRTFQAVYAFHRSMWVLAVVLGLLYLAYATLRVTERASEVVGYRSFVGALGVDPIVLFLLVLVAWSVSFATFRRSKPAFRRYFVQYLIADFLTIRSGPLGVGQGGPARGESRSPDAGTPDSGRGIHGYDAPVAPDVVTTADERRPAGDGPGQHRTSTRDGPGDAHGSGPDRGEGS